MLDIKSLSQVPIQVVGSSQNDDLECALCLEYGLSLSSKFKTVPMTSATVAQRLPESSGSGLDLRFSRIPVFRFFCTPPGVRPCRNLFCLLQSKKKFTDTISRTS